jgi:hypothetical protein
MTEQQQFVSVSQMARLVGLSRQRFYQLASEGVFLSPIYDITTRRPYYTQEMQETNLQVRRKNFGLNNRPILFYAKRLPADISSAEPVKPRSVSKQPTDEHRHLIDGLKSLGISTVNAQDVSKALKHLYAKNIPSDQGHVLREVFVYLMSRTRA